MQQLENDLDQTQEKLMNANQRLEEKEKALQNVSSIKAHSHFLLSLLQNIFRDKNSVQIPIRNFGNDFMFRLRRKLKP